MAVQPKPIPTIIQEKFFAGSQMLFETIKENLNQKVSKISVKYNHFSPGRKPQTYVSNQKTVFSQYQDFNISQKQQQRYVSKLTKFLNFPYVFVPNPKLMRQYELLGSRVLANDGANLSAVLFALNEHDEGKPILERLLAWIKQLPNEPYQDFEFDKTKYDNVMFGLKEGNEKDSVGANLLSDGTLRSLAMLTALETVKLHLHRSLIIIEEFDNGLHPSRIKALIKAILDCCQRQKIHVLITTHNPATLNALPPEQLEGVVLCMGEKLVRLYDLPRYPELLERGQLGELVTRRVIEQ